MSRHRRLWLIATSIAPLLCAHLFGCATLHAPPDGSRALTVLLGEVSVARESTYRPEPDIQRQQSLRRVIRRDLEKAGFNVVSDSSMSHDFALLVDCAEKVASRPVRLDASDAPATTKNQSRRSESSIRAQTSDGKPIETFVVSYEGAENSFPSDKDLSVQLLNGLFSSDRFSDYAKYTGIPSNQGVEAKDKADKILVVLPLPQTYGGLDRDAAVAIAETLRTVAGDVLGPFGTVVLTGETTLAYLKDNNVEPTAVCEGSCALDAAREHKAHYFVSGVVVDERYDRTLFLRLFETKGGKQISALQIRGSGDEIRKQVNNSARGFFRKAVRPEGR
jgi:hypothetical protein